jgi:hypothetical protein
VSFGVWPVLGTAVRIKRMGRPAAGRAGDTMGIARITALGAVMMLCCGQQAPPAPTNSHGGLLGLFTGNNGGHSLAGAASPAIAAREDFEAAVADYKKCLAVKSSFEECEGQRHIMDAAATAMESAR